jgi:phage terminase large subunit GpA-like protein
VTYTPDLDALFDGAVLLDAFVAGLAPDPSMTVTEWADRFRKLPQETSKEHGQYNSSRTPYIVEPQDNLSPSSPVIRTVIMKGAQIGGSETGLNLLGYIVDVAQGPVIIVCPTVEMAERHSETRIKPMIRLCKSLREKMGDPDEKKTGNKLLFKRFPGGHFVLTGANSGATLRSLPARYMIFEEPDAYPADVDGEGSAIDIVSARGFTYGYRRKEFLNCTPKLASSSVIYKAYMAGDQRSYMMPCPHCGHLMTFSVENFRWTKGYPDSAHMECPNPECRGEVIERKHKTQMMAWGKWIPKIKDAPRHMARSYYIPSFFSPVGMLAWSSIAIVAGEAEGGYAKTKTLYNTYYGLPWSDATDTPKAEEILGVSRACSLRARELPEWTAFVTAGVDIGIDHIEIGVWAFGRGEKRHLVEQIRLRGSKDHPELWMRLSETIKRQYLHPAGAVMRISQVFVDRGKWPDLVDKWLRTQDRSVAVGVKGHKMDDQIKEAVHHQPGFDGKPVPGPLSIPYFLVNSSMFKLELYSQINRARTKRVGEIVEPVVTYHNQISQAWAEQLVGEDYVTTFNKSGNPVSNWIKHTQGQRVEALDTANYARAAAAWKGSDTWIGADWERERKAIEIAALDLARALDAKTASLGRTAKFTDVGINYVALPVDDDQEFERIQAAAMRSTAGAVTLTQETPIEAPQSIVEERVVHERVVGVVGDGHGWTRSWEPQIGEIQGDF